MRNQNIQRTTIGIFVLLILSLAAFTLAAPGQKKAPGSVLVPEKGKFNIILDGQSVGNEEYEIAPAGGGWTAKGTTHLKAPDSPSTTITSALTLQADGTPISYEWTSQTDKTNGAHILFANGVAKMTLQMQGARPYEQDLSFGSPLIAVLDNNLYHQYAVLALVYDWSKRGTQNFPVIIPQELTPGTITVDWAGAVSAGGKTYEALKVVTSDLEVTLLLDTSHRLMRLEVPAKSFPLVIFG